MAGPVNISQNLAGDGEITLASSTVAALPATYGATEVGALRLVTDAGAGDVPALVYWDGTNWVDLGTGATVAA